MTPFDQLIYGDVGITLRHANELLHEHKKDCLPIIDDKGALTRLYSKRTMKITVVTHVTC